ncbi:hypothetical protein [Amycolatopsis thailandensis]|nr:hypothetical protein [Amycolatopsis thailandensis]
MSDEVDGRPVPEQYEHLLEELNLDDHLTREVYAYFGLAAYLASVIEHGLVNIIVLSRVAEARAGKTPITSDPWESSFKKTFGQLVHRFTKLSGDEERKLQEDLARCLTQRNFLIHGYWRERAETVMSQNGKLMMLEELSEMHQDIRQLNEEVDRVTFDIGESLGVSREAAEAEYQRMLGSVAE